MNLHCVLRWISVTHYAMHIGKSIQCGVITANWKRSTITLSQIRNRDPNTHTHTRTYNIMRCIEFGLDYMKKTQWHLILLCLHSVSIEIKADWLSTSIHQHSSEHVHIRHRHGWLPTPTLTPRTILHRHFKPLPLKHSMNSAYYNIYSGYFGVVLDWNTFSIWIFDICSAAIVVAQC